MRITLNSFFDHIYCVNLDKRYDRWNDSQKEFKKYQIENVERFSATDGEKIPSESYSSRMSGGDIGAFITHTRLFNNALSNGYKNFLLLEDDVEFKENFNTLFDVAVQEVPADWEILHFGGNHVFGEPVRFTDNVSIPTRTLATHAVAFSNSVYEKILDLIDDLQPADLIYSQNFYRFKSYEFNPPLAWQRAGWSDVTKSYSDYDFLRKK